MKYYPMVIICLLAMTVACKKKHETIKEVKEFKINTPKKVANATFTVISIVDNRCPENMNCVSPGSVSVYLKVQEDFDVHTLKFCVGDCKEIGAIDDIIINLSNVKYEIKLINVIPLPNATTPIAPEFIQFEISRD
ncbi:hypothetical protein ACFOWA_02675 [Pedobacter lithocola]|uniref:Lipoprotein n=1 Tax=Pedobacter lithocola TaxID=1908239 RepID=A0ABV8P5Z1_9SPHI